MMQARGDSGNGASGAGGCGGGDSISESPIVTGVLVDVLGALSGGDLDLVLPSG